MKRTSVLAGRVVRRATATAHLGRALLREQYRVERRAVREQHLAYYRGVWTAAADAVGVPVRDVRDGWLEIDLGSAPLRVRGTHCSIDGRDALDRAGDKVLLHDLLAVECVPMPVHRVFTLDDLDPAVDLVRTAPGPCVVKPGRDGAVGRGVSTGVTSAAEVAAAAVAAAAVGARASRASRTGGAARRLVRMLGDVERVPLLVEHQVPGSEYRLLFLDGELVDAIRRGPPTVTGDGVRSVRQLLAAANQDRLRAGGRRAQMLVSDDVDHRRTLVAQGLTAESVPVQGAVVRLKSTINENAPENNHPATATVCDAVVADAARAATALGVRWAGVDVITPDPSVPLEQAGGVILEVNTTPGLAMHHHGGPDQIEPATVLLRRLARARETP